MQVNQGVPTTLNLPIGEIMTVVADATSSGIAYRLSDKAGGTGQGGTAIAAGETVTFGPFLTVARYQIKCDAGFLTFSTAANDPTTPEIRGGTTEISESYAETGESHQVIAVDLEVDSDAGSDDGTDPKFLAPIMGNILGDAVAGEGNYLGGLIGAFSITDECGSDYPTAPVMGVVMDGATDVDACVLAVIDGSDPSATTRARAAFGVRMLNNSGDSGVDYGLDLHDAGSAHYSGGGDPFSVTKAAIRLPDQVCWITGAGVPVDYTDGDPVATGEGIAAIGSLYTDRTNGNLYINAGTQAQPTWKLVTRAA
jgi:hypothetical protein